MTLTNSKWYNYVVKSFGGKVIGVTISLLRGENSFMKEKVEAVLAKVKPALQNHGGDVELVGIDDGVVSVRLKGACGGCPMATMTIKNGIEQILKKELPEVKEVVSVP